MRSVTVIVGLRPYTAKANILPEQTIGRGLRLMFRDLGNCYTERVDVIGNKKFLEFVEQLEREEDLQLETFELGKDKVCIVTIEPMAGKLDKDIALPVLNPMLVRKKSLAEEIAALDVMRFVRFTIEYTDAAGNLRYYEPDFVTVLADGTHYLIETKGLEDVNVAYKDRAARMWCENASMLTGISWTYLKVRQSDYNSLQPGEFADLVVLSS